MQHERQEIESELFPFDREYSKRRKFELSPTDSGFGDSDELEQDYKFLDTPPSDPLEPLPDGTELLEERRQRDFKHYHRGSTDSDYHSEGSDGKDLGKEHKERDSESLPRVFDGANITELLETHVEHDSESTDPDSLSDTSNLTEGSELLEENEEHDSEHSGIGITNSESLSGVFKGSNATKPLEKHSEHNSEYFYPESPDSESFPDETNGAVELEEHKKFHSEYSEKGSTESLNSLEESKQVNETDLLKISLYPYKSLNEYLWQPRFNDDSSYYNAYEMEETEEQQFQRAIQNSLIENIPDEREVRPKGRRSRRERFEENEMISKRVRYENKIDSKRVNYEENKRDSRRVRFEEKMAVSKRVRFEEKKAVSKRARFEEKKAVSKRARFEEKKAVSKRVRFEEKKAVSKRVCFEEKKAVSKRVRFEENEMDSIPRSSGFRSMEDYIFSQFNVTGDVRTLHPEKFSESSEELSKKGHHFIANLLRSMTAKGQVGPKIDEEVRNLVLNLKETMKGDESLQIHWLAACLLQIYTDMHTQLDGVLQFSKRTGGELEQLYDKMAGISSQYLSDEPDCHTFREIMEYLDDLQVEVFLNQSEGMKGYFNALKVLANVMKVLYEGRLSNDGNSDEDAYLNLGKVISFFCPLLVNLCDTAFHTVKKCKEFYRVRNYVLSRLRKN